VAGRFGLKTGGVGTMFPHTLTTNRLASYCAEPINSFYCVVFLLHFIDLSLSFINLLTQKSFLSVEYAYWHYVVEVTGKGLSTLRTCVNSV